MSVGEEPVEEIDGTGSVLRIVTRAEMRSNNLLHRMVAVAVIRTNGRVVVHQRAPWKDVHPSKWDVAFGGVPAVGESSESAAIRELAEEAGLALDPTQLVDLGEASSEDSHTRWRGRFFTTIDDAELHPADGEVVDWKEVAPQDLAAWAAGTPLPDDTTKVVLPIVLRFLAREFG